MSSNQHTPEPWAVGTGYEQNDPGVFIFSEGKSRFGSVIVSSDVEPSEANARRIVACVNACRGLSTDDLEKSGLVSAVGYELQRLQVQRDELLSALKNLVSSIDRACLCGRGESCSACSRSDSQRLAENAALALVAKCETQPTAIRRDIEEFSIVWFEQSQKWIVLLPDGTTIDRKFGAIGHAVHAVFDLTGRGEAEFDCVETGDFFRYVKCDEHWSSEAQS